MSHLLGFLFFLSLVPLVTPLFCYTCVFPTISPLDCIKFPQKCPPGQVCLSSRAVASRGDFRVVLYEKSCIVSALCGLTGEKYAMGLNFTFTNECCETNLCNAVVPSAAPWTSTTLSLVLPLLLTLW
uniref:Ly6 domain containing, pigment cell n=1 Tax=Scleropages formosus TaxID=113540 RepID=A0A8C9S668_SCLFO